MLPTDPQERKNLPITTGVLNYFPDAIAAVSHVSKVGNDQHNPGQPLHWAKHKSTDHANCIGRHLLEQGTLDTDGTRHSAKLAWRALALCQMEIEAERAGLTLDQYIAHLQLEADVKERESEIVQAASAGVMAGDLNCMHIALDLLADDEDEDEDEDEADDGCADNTIPRCYIAGPMRGYEDYNFPAFDAAVERARARDWAPISPADLDREVGFDPAKEGDFTEGDLIACIRRDIEAIITLDPAYGDCLAVLDGWERSTGAVAEVMVARWRGLPVVWATEERFGRPVLPAQVNGFAMIRSLLSYFSATKGSASCA